MKTLWTQAEEDLLREMVGTYPFPVLAQQYRRQCRSQGFTERTDKAIESKISRLGLSVQSVETNIKGSCLAEALGIPSERVYRWVRECGLAARKFGRRCLIVRKKDVKQFVLKYPERFSDIDRDRLFWLLDSWRLVAQVKSTTELTPGKRRPLQRSDGKIFDSIASASRASFISPSCLRIAIERSQSAAGHKWQYADNKK